MQRPGEHTELEIYSQPDVWVDVLERVRSSAEELNQLYDDNSYESILFTGCGSTFYLSLAAASVFEQLTGHPSRGIPASEIWLNPASLSKKGTQQLLIAVSRSGETTETLRAVDAFKQRGGGKVLSFSCYPDSSLMSMGDLNISFPSAQEQSVAQTRAFSSLYLACIAFAASCARRDDLLAEMERIPSICKTLLANYADQVRTMGAQPSYDRFYFLGGGTRYGLAAELSLKMKEMSLSHSEAFHFLEFRHGPMSMVTPSTLVVGLLSEDNAEYEQTLLDEMEALGASVLSIGERGGHVEFQSELDPVVQSILYLPLLQLLAFEYSLTKGLNPDQPHNLNAVVRL